MKTFKITSTLLFIYYLFYSCATNPVTGKKEFMLVSKEQEIAMGQQADPEIVSYFGLYDNEALQRFIDEKGQEMAKISHRSELKYDFKIVDSPVVNAFAVPGGYVYFTRGIMAHFNNEAEFAGVLGHEIGHITARHSAKQQSNTLLAQAGLIAGILISPEVAQFADIAQQGIGLLFLQFSRNHESQSDRLGVEYSTKIGYNAAEMADFFRTLDRLQTQSGAGEIPTFLSTHPDPNDRLEKVRQQAEKWEKKAHATSLEVNRDTYLQMIDGLIYGEDPKQGYVSNGVFYHPVLKFQFPLPQQWTYQNSPQQVQMAPQNGEALMVLMLAQGNTLEDAARAVLTSNQLTLIESEKVSVNGLNAIAMIADQQQEQLQLRTLSYIIEYGGNFYAMIGISTLEQFNSYALVFSASMENFRTLTDPEKINVQPERISIQEVQENTTLAKFLQSFNIPEERFEELAILNGMELNEPVKQGMLIKTLSR
jgi:predicted Zn-dependent protease